MISLLTPHNEPFQNAMWHTLSTIHDFISHLLYMVSVSDVTISQVIDWGTNQLWKVMCILPNFDSVCYNIGTVVQESVFVQDSLSHCSWGFLPSLPAGCAGDIVTFTLKVNWQLLTRQIIHIKSQQRSRSHLICWTYNTIQIHSVEMPVSVCKSVHNLLGSFIVHHIC